MGNPRNRSRKRTRKGKNTRDVSKAKNLCVNAVNAENEDVPINAEQAPTRPASPTSADQDQLTPLSHGHKENASASRRKLNLQQQAEETAEGEKKAGFILIDSLRLADMFTMVSCPTCKDFGLQLTENCQKKWGFSKELVLQCPNCFWRKEFNTSSYAKVDGKSRNSMEINVRMVMAFREIGIGYEGLNDFATVMNMTKPMKRKNYNKIINQLHEAYTNVASESMKAAAEEVKVIDGTSDIAASFDGSWQKPGHSSINGIVSAISVSTGKVLDFEVKSKKCKVCDEHANMDKLSQQYIDWKESHDASCTANHKGSSGQMEVAGVLDMYRRSEEKNGMRYVKYIGDGDSSTYNSVAQAKPYGNDVLIEKKECVGHVQKRLGTRLRKLKASSAKKKLSDGKTIGGRGRLTEKLIDSLQNYYGLSIRQNKGNLDGMVNDTLAGLYHTASSEKDPQHHLCPKGSESWCGWQRDLADGTRNYKPKKGLDKAVVDAMLPVYQSLSEKSLLSRCLDSYTQNPNESLNNMIWRRCPKKVFQGKKVVELCTASAVCSFNDGGQSIIKVLKLLGISPGDHTIAGITAADEKRVQLADIKGTEKAKRQRKKLRAIRKGLWDKTKDKEGVVYQSGAF